MSGHDIRSFMEQRYKEALRQIYQEKLNLNQSVSTYQDALFGLAQNYFLPKQIHRFSEVNTSSSASKTVTEKTLILDSFHQFGIEKLQQNENRPMAIEGGVISARIPEKDGHTNSFTIEPLSRKEVIANFTDRTSQTLTTARYMYSSLNKEHIDEVKVIFISDTFNSNDLQAIDENLLEFYSLFEDETAQLFSKMVAAMKLDRTDYLLTAVKQNQLNEESDCLDNVIQEILSFRPKLIITMGITPTNALLQLNKRLKDIHGKFYRIKINDFSVEVMPLFSPNLLNTAVNMKKIAWEDMQKAMNKLNR